MNKYVFPANRPDGSWSNWRIGSGWFEVAGTEHRYEDVLDFLNEVGKVWGIGKPFGVALEKEPNNPHHSNAIRVVGLIGDHKNPSQRYHLGFVPRDAADEAARLYGGIPIVAELKQAKIGTSRVFISIAALIPKGTPKEQ